MSQGLSRYGFLAQERRRPFLTGICLSPSCDMGSSRVEWAGPPKEALALELLDLLADDRTLMLA